jgi:hypothetical protein
MVKTHPDPGMSTRRTTARSRSDRWWLTRRAWLRPFAISVITKVRRSYSPTSRVINPRFTSRSRILVNSALEKGSAHD